jgi:hypothetical protein
MLIFNMGYYTGQLKNVEECYLTFIKFSNSDHKFVISSPDNCKNELESSKILKDVPKHYFKEDTSVKSRYYNVILGFLLIKNIYKSDICILEPDIRFIKPIKLSNISHPLFMKSYGEIDEVKNTQISLAKILKLEYSKEFDYIGSGAIIPYSVNIIEELNDFILNKKVKKLLSTFYKINHFFSIEEVFFHKYSDIIKDNMYIRNIDQKIDSNTFMIHYENYFENCNEI